MKTATRRWLPLLPAIIVTAAALMPTASAEIRFPSNSFDISELEAAQAEASKTNKPIAFVYTDKETSCSLCSGATATILNYFRSSSVIVYLKNSSDAPREVSKVLSSKGKFIPKVALFSPDLEKAFGISTYEEIKADGTRPLLALKRASKE